MKLLNTFLHFLHSSIQTAKSFSQIFWAEMGFESATDFIRSVFIAQKGLFLVAHSVLAFMLSLHPFVQTYIWDPPKAYYILAILIAADTITGMLVALVVRKEKFNRKKFYRSGPILVAHTFFFAMVHNGASVSQSLNFLPTLIFNWFFIRNLWSIITDFQSMRLAKADFVNFFKKEMKDKLNIELGAKDKKPDQSDEQ